MLYQEAEAYYKEVTALRRQQGNAMNAHGRTSFDPAAVSYLASIGEVRARHPAALSRATDKVITRLDKHCRAIIERATFVVIGTHGSKGADVSPRGDPPGFVRVLDERHLLLPDRIGNNRFDSMENIFQTGDIGMLFIVPGMAEVLRINGTARITDDAALLAPCAVQGRAPQIGVLVQVSEAYLHCAKAINPPVGSVAAYRPQYAAGLRRHAGRSLRRPHRRGERAAGCRDGAPRHVLTAPAAPAASPRCRRNDVARMQPTPERSEGGSGMRDRCCNGRKLPRIRLLRLPNRLRVRKTRATRSLCRPQSSTSSAAPARR